MPVNLDPRRVAAALGGTASARKISAPGPGHGPNDRSLSVLVDPNAPEGFVAHSIGQRLQVIHASSERDLDAAFASMKQLQAGAALVAADPFFASQRDQIVSLAARYAIPAVYEQRAFATAGGLMSYGTNLVEAYRQAGIYTGRILNGERPNELPVLLANKFEFVINLKVAKTLGLTVSHNLLSTADDVIE